MKKIAAIALSLSLVSTAASAVVIDATVDGLTRRINCGSAAGLAASGLPAADIASCQQFFETAAGAGGTGAGGAAAGGAAAGAFGVGGAGSIALAALGIALVAGFGGSGGSATTTTTTN
jgi:hypothetical protein